MQAWLPVECKNAAKESPTKSDSLVWLWPQGSWNLKDTGSFLAASAVSAWGVAAFADEQRAGGNDPGSLKVRPLLSMRASIGGRCT
jgi:hypothetical protein